jgi:hypothetical protein
LPFFPYSPLFRADSQSIWYRIADPRIEELFATLHSLFCRPADAHRPARARGKR